MVCKTCGTLIGPIDEIKKRNDRTLVAVLPASCRLCGDKADVGYTEVPYVFKFLVTQLASMNINVKLDFNSF